jgi:phage FluMu protein Com
MHNDTLTIQCPTCGETDEITELAYRNADRLCCRHCNKATDKSRFKAYITDTNSSEPDWEMD